MNASADLRAWVALALLLVLLAIFVGLFVLPFPVAIALVCFPGSVCAIALGVLLFEFIA